MRPCALLAGLVLAVMPLCAAAALKVVIIEGLGGEPLYTQQFDAQARALLAASQTLTAPRNVQLLAGAEATRGAILSCFHSLAGMMSGDDQLILYLVGHGSYDGREYKFNIAGPDLSDHDIAGMLDALPARRQLLVATGSASGALLAPLRKPQRVLITATRNGDEKNVTRFGAAFAAALTAMAADTDKNGAISAQEAYAFAARRVQDDFRREALLASEHPVLQENGAGDRFTVASLKPPAAGASLLPVTALTRRRDELDTRIQALEQRKATLPGAQYSAQLEQLLLQLAQLQERIDGGATNDPPAVNPRAGSSGGEHAH